MFAEFVARGENLNYVNPTDEAIHPGTLIVLGCIVGIAACRIEPGELGSVATTGVWELPKGSESVSMGDKLYYNSETDAVAVTAGDDSKSTYIGFAAAGAAEESDVVRVALNR